MKQLFSTLCVITFFIQSIFAQDSVKTNPVIFGEGYIGAPVAGVSGIETGLSLNYQVKKSLITLRMTEFDKKQLAVALVGFYIPIPIILDLGHTTEYAAMYGLRSVKAGHSFSFSFGISQNTYVARYYDDNYNFQYQTQKSYVGLPFEFNIKWFKKEKSRYRIFYILPVGKPTGFGRSFGLKLSGNISQHSYVAIGLVGSLGYHKHY